MKPTYKKLLQNIYFAAKYHAESNRARSNDLSRSTETRARDLGLADAYEYIVQFVEHNDTIGQADYKKVHKMKEKFPTLYSPRED